LSIFFLKKQNLLDEFLLVFLGRCEIIEQNGIKTFQKNT